MAPPDRCFVSVPFGRKLLPSGESFDFDRLYFEGIGPAVLAVGLTPVRADEMVTSGLLTRAIIEAVARSAVMIADVSTRDPNVCYELGLRDALAPRTTLILSAQGTVAPFHLRDRRHISYSLAAELTDGSLEQFRDQLSQALRSQLESKAVDSPFFQLFPVEPLLLPDDPPAARHRRERAEDFRARLLQARHALPEQGTAMLRELERSLADAGVEDERLLTDLMHAYRDFAAWDDVVRLISAFPPGLRDSPPVVQQHALALNRRSAPGDATRAETLLIGLIDRLGPEAETYGLLGSIYKQRYFSSREQADLEAAIRAYRDGWQADPEDVYPGLNLVTLLTLAGGPAAEEEIRRVIPRLRRSVERRIDSGPVDYWDAATALVLAVIDRDWEAAGRLLTQVREAAAEQWMIWPTRSNLELLAGAMDDARDRVRIDQLIRRLTLEVSTR